MHKPKMHCNGLLQVTVEALNDDVALIVLALQMSNLELCVNVAAKR